MPAEFTTVTTTSALRRPAPGVVRPEQDVTAALTDALGRVAGIPRGVRGPVTPEERAVFGARDALLWLANTGHRGPCTDRTDRSPETVAAELAAAEQPESHPLHAGYLRGVAAAIRWATGLTDTVEYPA